MAMEFIETKLENGVYIITLNRPKKLNSFNRQMGQELQSALSVAESKPEIRCILLTAAGKAFCAGQDLGEVVKRSQDEEDYELGDTVRETYNPIIKAIRTLEKPVVCVVNGIAAGAGANIALACDIVCAVDHAEFVLSFSKIGLVPDSGGTFLLPKLIGLPKATAMAFLDEKISSMKATEMGLIYNCYKPEYLFTEAMQICEQLAAMPTRGFGLTKRAFNQAFYNTLEEHLELEADLQSEAGKTHDYNEGVQAFLEKRNPEFKGE